MAAQDCGPPEWLVDCAWQVHELTRTDQARQKFGKMLRRWAVEQGELIQTRSKMPARETEFSRLMGLEPKHLVRPELEYHPDLDGSPLFQFGAVPTLAAQYAVAALVHDFCLEKVRERAIGYVPALNPWGVERNREVAIPPADPSEADDPREFSRGKAEFLALLRMTMPHITQAQEPLIRECIEAMRADLAGEGGKESGEAAGGTPPEELAGRGQGEAVQKSPLVWLAHAMLLVRDHPEWSDAKIAREVRKDKSILSRSPEYQAAAAMARGTKADRPKGHVTLDADSGRRDIEAYSQDDPAEMDWDDH